MTTLENNSLTKTDVFGDFERGTTGMIVATANAGGHDFEKGQSKGLCPIFGDHLPSKSCTAVFAIELLDDIEEWMVYVHGGNCITKSKALDGNKMAVRAEYQCW